VSELIRRALAILEALVALLFFWGFGVASLSAHRVGGDGIATGIAHDFALPCMVIGVLVGVAAFKAWRGGEKWWRWQVIVLVAGPAILIGTMIVLIVMA